MLNLKSIKQLNLFYIFLLSHLTIWTLVPSLTNKNLPLDTIEALAWGSNLDWGFTKHPPMSAFFVEFFYKIFGSQDWSYYFLSQIFVIFSFFIVYKLSEEIFQNKTLSIFSVLLLEGIFFYNFTTPEFNVNICQLPFWALTVYFSWRIFNSKKLDTKDFILLGIFSAFGFLSKYLFIYLLTSVVLLFVYFIYFLKDRKFDFKYIISIETFLILIVPHIIWLFNNEFVSITYGIARTGLESSTIIDHLNLPLIFLAKQIGILIPFLFLTFSLIKKIKYNFNINDKKLIFLLLINILPILLILITSIILGSKIRTMWMTPFYLFLGTLFIYIFEKQINYKNMKNFIISFSVLFLLSPISYAFISLIQKDKRTDYSGKEIAAKVQEQWNKDFKDKITVVLGDEWSAGNLSYHLKSRPRWEGKISSYKLDQLNKFICIDKICVGNK